MARPTKYSEEFIVQIEQFTETMDTTNFTERCSVDHIACLLCVRRSTIYNWQKENEQFLDTIKRWESKRNCVFYKKIAEYPQAVWIFLAKNWLGMADKQEHKHEHEVGDKAAKIMQQPIQFKICKLERPKQEPNGIL